MKALCSEGVANHNNRVMRCASRGARRSVRRSLQATQAELEDQQERLSYAGKSLKPGFRPQGDAPVVHGDQFINYGNLGSAGRGSSGDRSLPRRPFPRSRSRRARARRKAHAGRVGPAIRQVEQERLRGCGSDCRSRAAADDAVRCHQERDSTRSPGSAPCEGSLDRPEDWRDQSARGFLLEHEITVPAGPAHLKRQIPSILEIVALGLGISLSELFKDI